MTTLAEKCAELLNEWDHRIDFDGSQTLRTGEEMAALLRQLSELIGQNRLTGEAIQEIAEAYHGDDWGIKNTKVHAFALAIEQAARAPLLAKIAELERQLATQYYEGYAQGRGDGYAHGYAVGTRYGSADETVTLVHDEPADV